MKRLVLFYNKLKLFFTVDWCTTIWLNFTKLPYCQALRLPILLYNSKIRQSSGSIILNIPTDEVKFGMIKMGVSIEDSCMSHDGILLSNEGTLILKGSGFIGNGSAIIVKKNAKLSLGKNFGITGDFKLHCYDSVSIGDWFSSAWNVSIADTDFHITEDPFTNKKSFTKQITIGDFVWVCQRSVIMKGSTIPDNYTVAACSLVNKGFIERPYTVVGGIPAKEISRLKRSDYEQFLKDKVMYITKGLATFNI